MTLKLKDKETNKSLSALPPSLASIQGKIQQSGWRQLGSSLPADALNLGYELGILPSSSLLLPVMIRLCFQHIHQVWNHSVLLSCHSLDKTVLTKQDTGGRKARNIFYYFSKWENFSLYRFLFCLFVFPSYSTQTSEFSFDRLFGDTYICN